MRDAAMILACISALSSAAAGCRSDSKPPERRDQVEQVAPPASTAGESVAQESEMAADLPPTISITEASFGDLRFGTSLTEEAIRRTFPGATFRKVEGVAPGGGPAWLVKREADGLVAAADAGKIVVEGGAIELHGVRAGDDASALAGGPFAKTTCSVEEENDDAFCFAGGVSLRVGHCPEAPRRGKVPVARLSGCKVREIWWFAVEPTDE